MTHQKIRHVAMQRNEESRGKFMAEMTTYDPEMFLWIDETGCDRRKLIRDYGYGIRGIPPIDHTFKLSGKRYSVIAIMSTDGVEDIYIHEGSVNGEIFLDFIRKCLLPLLMPFNGSNPNSIVILDNASVHKCEEAAEMINGVGALLCFLPPYSPDLTPIEELFAEVKGYYDFLTFHHIYLHTLLLVPCVMNVCTTVFFCYTTKSHVYDCFWYCCSLYNCIIRLQKLRNISVHSCGTDKQQSGYFIYALL